MTPTKATIRHKEAKKMIRKLRGIVNTFATEPLCWCVHGNGFGGHARRCNEARNAVIEAKDLWR